MPGYSGTPLYVKLGLTPAMKVYLVNAPREYFSWINSPLKDQLTHSPEAAGMVHVFSTTRKELERTFLSLTKSVHASTIIWISWYKKSSGVATDITEDIIREIVLPAGWVDVKVCAVSDQWSGLKIVKRKASR